MTGKKDRRTDGERVVAGVLEAAADVLSRTVDDDGAVLETSLDHVIRCTVCVTSERLRHTGAVLQRHTTTDLFRQSVYGT